LVEHATGEPFVHEARVGFVAERLPIVIAPACAGLNFFVIALLTLVVGFVLKWQTAPQKLLWLAACPVLAYAATTLANAVRITAAVGVHELGLRAPLLSASALHRALGVAVYLTSLWALFAATERAMAKRGSA
jgi:exosortase K